MKKEPKQLLLVDDDPSLLRVLEHQLSQAGYSVTTAENLQQARQRFVEKSFDAVVCDLALPDGSGIDFFEICAPAKFGCDFYHHHRLRHH
ncbi:MAG: response regulator [candidate division KSB1 bacterium]|nr:response regulator [candidate division KSB1 bacterium]